MLLALPLTGIFFCLGAVVTDGPSYQESAVVGVHLSPPPSSTAPDESRAAAFQPGNVPVVTATPGAQLKVPPTALVYPTLGIDMPVVPTGVSEDGQMEIPGDAGTAGWYRYGVAPADGMGRTVIAAHNGSPETPVGPLDAISGSRPGDEVRVVDQAGDHHGYRVTSVEHLDKHDVDFGPYFSRTSAPTLVLVTCGGRWLPEEDTYSDNVIVIAEPLT